MAERNNPVCSCTQGCRDNTEGDRCERCAPGFYGVVRGLRDDCKPCACPLTNPENKYDRSLSGCLESNRFILHMPTWPFFVPRIKSFSPTCAAEGFEDYRCTACPEGYEGKYCERWDKSPVLPVALGKGYQCPPSVSLQVCHRLPRWPKEPRRALRGM